jgi:transposase
VRDGWAPYRQFDQAAHQTCLAHLLRRCRELQADHPGAHLPYQVQTVLQQALQLRDRRAAGTISAHGVAVARGHLLARLTTVLDHSTTVPAVRRFATHLDREWPALFSFLYDPTIDATNWRAEQALRPAVVNRKVSGGNRTWRGAQTQQVLATLIRTTRQRQLDPLRILGDLLRERVPRVAAALFPT